MDKIAVFHRLLDAVQACLRIITRIRITQIRTDLHQSKIKLMIKIMKIDVVADQKEESLIRDGSHGYGMNQKVQEVDLDLMTGMRNGKDLEIREETVPDMGLEKIPEMKNGMAIDMVLERVQEEVPEVMSGKALDTVHEKTLEEVPEVMNGKALDMVPEMALEEVLDMVHVKVLEEVQGEMSKEVLDMAQEIILEMKLLSRKSSIIPLMKPDLKSEDYLVSELRPIHPKYSMGLGMTRNIPGTTQLLNSLRVLTLGGTLRNTETDRDGEAIKTGASIDAETEEVPLLIAEVTSEVPDAS